MTAVAVCLIIGIINLILWAVLFLHFKSKYSSAAILEDIANELNKLIRDINNETARCVTIVEACKEGLLKLVDDAKKYTDLGHESLERKAKSAQVMNALNTESPQPKKRRASYSDLAPRFTFPPSPIQKDYLDKSPIDEVIDSTEDEYTKDFGSQPVQEVELNLKHNWQGEIATAELKVPEINISEIKLPEITKAQKQVLVEKNLRTQVLELHSEGFDLDTIAARLDISLTEVQLIVNLYGL